MADVEVGAVAPVEAPVAAPVEATPAPDTTADQVEDKQPEQPERTFTQKELDEIVQKRLAKESRRAERLGEERARREAAERELERIRAERTAPQQPQGAPREEDFAGRPYREYVEALTDWKFEQRMAKEREASQQQTAAQREQRQFDEQARYVHENIIAKGQEKFGEDFDRVFDVQGITEPMVASAADLPNGAEVLFHLSNDDAERFRIARLRPAQQAFALKDLSAKLAAPPKTTDTPPPIKPNSGAAKAEGYRPDMTDKQFAEWRRRQRAQRG